jgi:hypothetical protein
MNSPDPIPEKYKKNDHIFSGNILLLYAYDVGEDINLKKIDEYSEITKVPLSLPKHFKQYHMPLGVKIAHQHTNKSSHCISSKIHSFGVISLVYKIPFKDTMENIRLKCIDVANKYQQQSIIDAKALYRKIAPFVIQPKFFHMYSSYTIIQVDPQPKELDLMHLQSAYGSTIASTLRFETEILSEAERNEVLDSAVGYFRGSLIVIDIDAAFVYEEDYDDIIDLFEFANIQQVELRYFDKLLDQKLNIIYEKETNQVPLRAYLPFFETFFNDPVGQLRKLKVDISVITERLESSIKIAGEPYYSDIHSLLVNKLDLKHWSDGIERKLTIIDDLQTVYQQKIDTHREDIFSILVIILIFVEVIFGILNFLRH